MQFERVPFLNNFPWGLNYAGKQARPARGVTVRALRASNQQVLATTVTDAAGAYSLTVPSSTSITIQVQAQMVRDAAQPLPRWNVRVQESLALAVPYSHTTAAFDSSLGTQNVLIPTGISNNGAALGVRASGPFAILDTIYTSMQFLQGVDPQLDFPPLTVIWGPATTGTYFTVSQVNGVPVQHISLLNDLSEDTDEFDQHVVAHEFGHYIEANFSRSDNIGGSHGPGDRLDKRVAFGEGFGYAFASMALNDPFSRDSFVQNGTQVAGGFDVDVNPVTVPVNPSDDVGCWCSESSVWAILWDIYDANNEGVDSLALGFAPIWEVLTGPQRFTLAFTSIFSFIYELKQDRPGDAAAIDALVSAQNINSAGINPFATNETYEPFPDVLPLYTNVVPGTSQVVATSGSSTEPKRLFNKVGNRRYFRFNPATSGIVTATLATSNPDAANQDPDFIVHRSDGLSRISQDQPPGPEVDAFDVSSSLSYIIEAYDCANGCDEEQGTPGDYDLTLTVSYN